MRRLLTLFAVTALAAVGLAAAVPDGCYVAVQNDPETPDDDVVACQLETWFQDPGTNKAGNLAAVDAYDYPTWGVEPPAASVSDGAGGGFLGHMAAAFGVDESDRRLGATFAGSFTGPVDRMALTLHYFYNGYGSIGDQSDPDPNRATTRKDLSSYVTLVIDGTRINTLGGEEGIDLTTSPAETANAADKGQLTITGIAEAMQLFGMDMGADTEHTVEITVTPRYINTDAAVVFVFGTTEVPGGIVFNPPVVDEDVNSVPIF